MKRKKRRIDRNHFDAGRVLDMVRDHVDGKAPIDTSEALRLLEEACQAYLMLRNDATSLYFAVDDARGLAEKIKGYM